MPEHTTLLKQVLIEEFQQLYQHYKNDDIYACALVFNEYLQIDYLAISTQRSIYAEHEDRAQYLSELERWNIQKWRSRLRPAQSSALHSFRDILAGSAASAHSFSTPIPDQSSSNLQTLLDAFKQAKEALVTLNGQDLHQILFFIGLPSQPEIEIRSVLYLNPTSSVLQSFLHDRTPKQRAIQHLNRFKLSQADKDLLIDLAQLAEVEPYNELQVAHAAYLLTLEPNFMDTNAYIQKLVQTIAAMAAGSKDSCAMQKDEILARINQFYHSSHFTAQPAS
jgi:hypothetical protein